MKVWVVIENYFSSENLFTYVYKNEEKAKCKLIELSKEVGEAGLSDDVDLDISESELEE